MTHTKPLKGALIGAGNVTSFHLHAWQRIPQASIIAIADPDIEKALARAREFGIDTGRTYPSLADLLAAEAGLDFVDVAAPPEAHLELVTQAAEHNLHVNCQKPFAPSLAEAREMIAVCREAGVMLNVNENWRWRSWYRDVKQMVAAGEVGRPVYARIFSHGSSWLPGKPHRENHRFRSWERGIFYEWGIHHVDVLRFLFGEPTSVYARVAGLSPDLEGEDRAMVMLAFDDDLTALIDLSWSSYAPWGVIRQKKRLLEDVRIEGDKGTICLVPDSDSVGLIRLTTADGEWERPAYDCEPMEAYQRSYVAAQSHFVECLLGGARPETNAQDNYETLAITLAAYYAAEHDQVVNIADFKEVD